MGYFLKKKKKEGVDKILGVLVSFGGTNSTFLNKNTWKNHETLLHRLHRLLE